MRTRNFVIATGIFYFLAAAILTAPAYADTMLVTTSTFAVEADPAVLPSRTALSTTVLMT